MPEGNGRKLGEKHNAEAGRSECCVEWKEAW